MLEGVVGVLCKMWVGAIVVEGHLPDELLHKFPTMRQQLFDYRALRRCPQLKPLHPICDLLWECVVD